MLYADDDDGPLSPSESTTYTRADHGRKERLRRQVEGKQGKSLESDKIELKSQVELEKLRDNVIDGERDKDAIRDAKKQEEADKSKKNIPHTERIKEREERAVATAQDQPGPDILIKREEEQEDISPEEQVKQPG